MTAVGREPQRPRTGCATHRPRTLLALAHRNGIPYELERVVCSRCGMVLEERTLRRADA